MITPLGQTIALFEKTSASYVGAQVVDFLEVVETGLVRDQTDQASMDRWAPFHWQAIKSRSPAFATSSVHGINKDYLSFEVGAFPFLDETGNVTRLAALIGKI